MSEFLNREFKVIIIGGGVVGCAVLRYLSAFLNISPCILIEKKPHLVSAASAGNSGIVHCGFDCDLNTLEASLCTEGYKLIKQLHQECGLPMKQVGATLIAWNNEELEKLPLIVQKAKKNGIENIKILSKEELKKIEPNIDHNKALGAISIPDESVIDPWITPLYFTSHAIQNGGEIERDCEIIDLELEKITEHGKSRLLWKLHTNQRKTFRAQVVINCAGLFGDIVDSMNRPSTFQIKPRKGQFVILKKEASNLINTILLPVPNEKTKGVLVFPTVYGNLIVGPTAEEQENRDIAKTDQKVLDSLMKRANEMIPALLNTNAQFVIGSYAGLRPATDKKDYIIDCQTERKWITVAGIRSTGLTASLAIAKYVGNIIQKEFKSLVGTNKKTEKQIMQESSIIIHSIIHSINTHGYFVDEKSSFHPITHPITQFGLAKL